jgi:two-component system, NarL family, invasion response regulator UvrY
VIRVFVADDHAIVCEGLHAWVETVPDLSWAGSVRDGDALLEHVARDAWDVLVLDLSLPGRSGSELLREVRALRPALRVVIYSMYPASEYGVWALAAGASAYVSKSEPLSVLRDALLAKSAPTPAAPRDTHDAKLPHERLSARERDVFVALARGRSPSEIAWDLEMAPSTVSTHLKSIREKLSVRSTFEIAQYATRHGFGAEAPR